MILPLEITRFHCETQQRMTALFPYLTASYFAALTSVVDDWLPTLIQIIKIKPACGPIAQLPLKPCLPQSWTNFSALCVFLKQKGVFIKRLSALYNTCSTKPVSFSASALLLLTFSSVDIYYVYNDLITQFLEAALLFFFFFALKTLPQKTFVSRFWVGFLWNTTEFHQSISLETIMEHRRIKKEIN